MQARVRAAAIGFVVRVLSGLLGGCAAGIVFGDDEDNCRGERNSQGECRPAT